MQSRDPQSYDNAAEDAHLQGLDPADAGNASLQHIRADGAVRQDHTSIGKHRIDGSVHYKKGDHGRQGRNLLFRFCHSYGNAYRKYNRQVVKDHVSRLAEYH